MALNYLCIPARQVFTSILQEIFRLGIQGLWAWPQLIHLPSALVIPGYLVLLHRLFVELDELLDLVQTREAALVELLQLVDDLSELPFFDQVIDHALMILRLDEPGEDLHGVHDVALLLRLLLLEQGLGWLLLDVQEAAFDDELLPVDSLLLPAQVILDHFVLVLDFLLVFVAEELHLSEDLVQVVVVFIVEVATLPHVTQLVTERGDPRVVSHLPPNVAAGEDVAMGVVIVKGDRRVLGSAEFQLVL